MKLSEVKKFCDGILVKIRENLIDMLSKNKLGSGNKRLKGRDWPEYNVKKQRDVRRRYTSQEVLEFAKRNNDKKMRKELILKAIKSKKQQQESERVPSVI
ncbi:hypothetical protein Tco_0655255 [Tanacetum coccineum]|uniref:Uncharacterized protein n=1 Tax=Tanacetum coccineum TaxID=301880 RepID=A0ABQ4X5N0_9ASTR